MSINQKIRDGRKRLGMTEQQFADRIGVTRGAVQQWEKPDGTAPARKRLEDVADLLGITVSELVDSGLRPTQAISRGRRSDFAIEIEDIDKHPDYAPVRRVNVKAQAGVSGFSVEYVHDDEKPPIFFRRDWYRAKGFAPDRMIAVRVSGDSMIPTLHQDDLIVINTAQTQPQHSKTFLVSYEGEIVVKRLVRDDGQWWLTSDNPDQRRYPRVKCNGETQIIGEVVYRQTDVI